jgi:hypothetical protein
MEISLVQKIALRIKGKQASFVVNPVDTASANAALILDDTIPEINTEETVILRGPGDYEIGGVKITGIRGEKGVVYSLTIDGIAIVVGKIDTLSAMQQKLKDHNIVLALCKEAVSGAFLTTLAENSVIMYGEKAAETAQGFEKEKLKTMNKYTASAGKLPAEVEIVLLA